MPRIWKKAKELLDKNESFVMATILRTQGSSPRNVGTKFIVKSDGTSFGTIGGGTFEAQVQEKGIFAAANRISFKTRFDFMGQNAEATEMICGGRVDVLLEYFDSMRSVGCDLINRVHTAAVKGLTGRILTEIPFNYDEPPETNLKKLLQLDNGEVFGDSALLNLERSPVSTILENQGELIFHDLLRTRGTLFIFGAGHVGAALCKMASFAGIPVTVIDDRIDFTSREKLPEADETIVIESFENAFMPIDVHRDSSVVIVTRGHAHDLTVLAQALRSEAHYIGMIGSKRKIALIYEKLLSDGFSDDQLQKVHAPIGLQIGAETPEEIAVSILAEIIATRSKAGQSSGNMCAG